MVVIRLSRTGAKKRPFYHVVATDSRNARDSGNFIERLGYFNPIAKGAEVRLHLVQERIDHWCAKGAVPSERVSKLIHQAKQGPEAVAAASKKKAEKINVKRQAAAKAKASEKEAGEEASA